jgi:hypothetical protein
VSRAALPVKSMAMVDVENNATVEFNEWLSGIDGSIAGGGLGIGRREPLPPGGIVVARAPTIPFAKWLLWVDRATVAIAARKAGLPPSNFPIVGVDLKATIPFYNWCRYVDRTVP